MPGVDSERRVDKVVKHDTRNIKRAREGFEQRGRASAIDENWSDMGHLVHNVQRMHEAVQLEDSHRSLGLLSEHPDIVRAPSDVVQRREWTAQTRATLVKSNVLQK